MKDVERLKSMLARLKSGDQEADYGEDSDDMLAPLLQEIGETVLPRELRFQNDRNEELALIVSTRRVLRVSDVRPDALADCCRDVIDCALSEDDTAQLAAFRVALHKFLDGCEELRVTATRPKTIVSASDIGWGTDALARVWAEKVQPDAPAPTAPSAPTGDPFAAFTAISPAFIEWTAKGVTASKGNDGTANMLLTLANTSAFTAANDNRPAPVCTVLPGPAPQGTTIVHLVDGDRQAMVLLPKTGVADVARIWRASRA